MTFPKIASAGLVDAFNPKNVMRLLFLNRLAGLNTEQKKEFELEISKYQELLISFEGLSDWNPDNWQSARDENLKLFGPSARILLTIRDPREYLTSVYQQILQEGQVIQPNEFFVNEERYRLVQSAIRRGMLSVYNQDQFDLKRLVDLYLEKFSEVVVVALPKIGTMEFLGHWFQLSEDLRSQLAEDFSQNTRFSNRAYSNIAVKLTFIREKWANSFGLRSQSTHDFKLSEIMLLQNPIEDKPARAHRKANPLRRLKRKLWVWSKRLRRWRYVMQVVVNRALPYERYVLPAGVLDQAVIDKNEAFYQKIASESGGFQVFKKTARS